MISSCPHCGRSVSNDETISRVGGRWIPTACSNGDGPALGSPVVMNHLRFYVSCRDGSRRGYLMGPYPDYEGAEAHLREAIALANGADYRSPWYEYGICSSNRIIKTVFGE